MWEGEVGTGREGQGELERERERERKRERERARAREREQERFWGGCGSKWTEEESGLGDRDLAWHLVLCVLLTPRSTPCALHALNTRCLALLLPLPMLLIE